MSDRYAQRGGLIFHRILITSLLFAGASTVRAQDLPPHSPPADVRVDLREGGVVSDSYGYHRYGAPLAGQTIPRPGGWYGYGFPVKTYRWGWFGAARYYPTVLWHRGYYNDSCRWAYRSGY
jgi:hypothetical protein